MQYSKKIVPQQKYENFGIWNIPKKQDHNKNMKILEYGIFQEYSINNVPQQKNENFGIWNIPWNIPGIFQKMGHNARGRKV